MWQRMYPHLLLVKPCDHHTRQVGQSGFWNWKQEARALGLAVGSTLDYRW